MTQLALFCRQQTSLPLGICCLWNDWKSALAIAKVANLQFIRIPVFVDHVKTHYDYEIQERPKEILDYRKKI
jgi:predicted TIM-barrel enzyme